MVKWLVRAAIFSWLPIYHIVFHNFLIAPLIVYFGLGVATLIAFFGVAVWSSVFYLLLVRESYFDRVQGYLAQLNGKRGDGLLARLFTQVGRLGRRFLRSSPGETRLPLAAVLGSFVYPGPPLGVAMARLAYSSTSNVSLGALSLIWLGCAINSFVWTVIALGFPLRLLQEIAGRLAGMF